MYGKVSGLRVGPSILLNDLIFDQQLPADHCPALSLGVEMGIPAGLERIIRFARVVKFLLGGAVPSHAETEDCGERANPQSIA